MDIVKEAELTKAHTIKASRIDKEPSLVQAATAVKILNENFKRKLNKYSKKKRKKVIKKDIWSALLLNAVRKKLIKLQNKRLTRKLTNPNIVNNFNTSSSSITGGKRNYTKNSKI